MAEINRDDEQFNLGVDHAVQLLARVIGAPDTWQTADGSEDYDDDLSQTLLNILAARNLYDPENGTFGTLKSEKLAPVQGYAAGIPWSMHLRAYDVYCKKWGAHPAMIDLENRNCRGGFSTDELDDFIPGWREELSEITRLRTALTEIKPWTIGDKNAMLVLAHISDICDNALAPKKK